VSDGGGGRDFLRYSFWLLGVFLLEGEGGFQRRFFIDCFESVIGEYSVREFIQRYF